MTETTLCFRGREIRAEDIASIKALLAAQPGASRRKLSKLLCEVWDWRQENGQLRDMVCRGLMLALYRAGLIVLPAVRQTPPNNAIRHRAAEAMLVDQTPIEMALAKLGPIEIRQVRKTGDERLFNGLLHRFHYLGYCRPVGEHLKHLVLAKGRPIACFAWSSPPIRLGIRDRHIGWSEEARVRNLRLIAYNTRFLVLPWVRVPHLASHLLGRMARTLPTDWQAVYGHKVVYLESFVEPGRFQGTCYRAANWRFLGETFGRGHRAPTHEKTRPVKTILGLPLTKRFREILGSLG